MIGIYKITNQINNKCYIGQSVDIQRRWKEHRNYHNKIKRPLYLDFQKYGLQNFKFEIVEECDIEELDEKEKYWISYFDSFYNGYNLTPGGSGQGYVELSEEEKSEIVNFYLKNKTLAKTIEEFSHTKDVIKRVLKENNIQIFSMSEIKSNNDLNNNVFSKKKVNQYNLNGEYIQTFDSCLAAGKFINENNAENARSLIGKVCRGVKKSAYGYYWKYA